MGVKRMSEHTTNWQSLSIPENQNRLQHSTQSPDKIPQITQ